MFGGRTRLRTPAVLRLAVLGLVYVLLPRGVGAWDDPLTQVGEADIEEGSRARVGQIFVVGNQSLRQDIILQRVPLYPGGTFTPEDLRRAERNLADLNLFEVNVQGDLTPTVTVLSEDGKGEFKDILISVREKPTARLQWRIRAGLRAASAAWLNGPAAGLAEVLAE
jgi:Surface antigen variable number repeat